MNLAALMAILLWIVVLGVGGVGLVVAIIACFLRKWKFAKWSFVATLAGTLLTFVGGTLLFAFIWRPYDPTSEADLIAAYRTEFEVPPPAGIKVLKARQVVFGDSGGRWLLLQAAPEEIQKHVAKGFAPIRTAPRDFAGETGGSAPKWWTPPADRLQFYENYNWTKAGGWSHSEAVMGVDIAPGQIWFAASKM